MDRLEPVRSPKTGPANRQVQFWIRFWPVPERSVSETELRPIQSDFWAISLPVPCKRSLRAQPQYFKVHVPACWSISLSLLLTSSNLSLLPDCHSQHCFMSSYSSSLKHTSEGRICLLSTTFIKCKKIHLKIYPGKIYWCYWTSMRSVLGKYWPRKKKKKRTRPIFPSTNRSR